MESAADATPTLMARETAECSVVAARVIERNRRLFASVADRLRMKPPSVIVTCGRGSSDHAATYGKYLIETFTGVPVASAAPSVISLYKAPITAKGVVVIAVSQSGRSPDLLANVAAYREAGAYVVALVNDTDSPLVELAEVVVPLHAGTEAAVAATKSCIATLVAFASLVAVWAQDTPLQRALETLPATIETSRELDWSAALATLAAVDRMFVLGRGYSFGIAQEAALKLKETCAIQAEALSAAEARHGPMRIIGPDFPVLGFATSDQAGGDVTRTMAEFAGWGARALLAGAGELLPIIEGHPALEPIAMLTAFYSMVEMLARARGMDPDSPPRLQKVTRTL